jgi:hypothetical protein
MNGHETYIELVVGYALDALEPADEQLLLAHLPTCAECSTTLDDMRQVAADLAHGAADEEPPAELLDNLRAVIAAEPRSRSNPPGFGITAPDDAASLPAPLDLEAGRARRTRRIRIDMRHRALTARGVLAAAAAALIVIAGIGGYAINQQSDRNSTSASLHSEQQVLAHLGDPGAYTVTLASGGAATGAAVVDGNEVYLITHNLGQNDTKSSIYVLWAKNPTGTLVAIGGFDVRSNTVTVAHAALPAGMGEPRVFGVTHEAGRRLPAVPGSLVLGASTQA